MNNNLINTMRALRRTILLPAFFLCFFSTVKAQEYDTAVIVDEPVKETYPKDETDDFTIDTDDEDDFVPTSDYDSLRLRQRRIPPGAWKQMQEDGDFWYASGTAEKGKGNENMAPVRRDVKNGEQKRQRQESQEYEETSAPYNPVSRQPWFQTLMWIIIVGGFAGALMWYLASSNVGLFSKKNKAIAGDEDDGEMPEDIFAINYQKEIDKAAAQGNFRLAIRLMYLRLLKNMAEINIIQYKQDKTNFDYLLQLHSTAYYTGFFRITRHYEYTWYGKFDVSQEAYGLIRTSFDQFEKTTG